VPSSDKSLEEFVAELAAELVNLVTKRVEAFDAAASVGLAATVISLVLAAQNAATLQKRLGRAPTVEEVLQLTLNKKVFTPMCRIAIQDVLPIMNRLENAS
jgi:hypothetical protein